MIVWGRRSEGGGEEERRERQAKKGWRSVKLKGWACCNGNAKSGDMRSPDDEADELLFSRPRLFGGIVSSGERIERVSGRGIIPLIVGRINN